MSIQIEHSFDDKTYRHFVNGFLTVMHCHHYMSLATRLAEHFADIGAPRIMAESAEDSVRPMLDDYIAKHGITAPADRLAVGTDYYSAMGMGKLEATGTEAGGEVVMKHSHIDQGWIMKWGNRDTPMNYWTCGYIAAMFGAAFGKPARSYRVEETASLVTGAPEGKFTVTAA